MGPAPCQIPAPVRRPHRRTAPPARPRDRDARAGPETGKGRLAPDGGAVRRGVEVLRGFILTWGDVVRWDDGSGRITVIRCKTDVEAQGAVVAITPAALNALNVTRYRTRRCVGSSRNVQTKQVGTLALLTHPDLR